jgi:hypothetical protein
LFLFFVEAVKGEKATGHGWSVNASEEGGQRWLLRALAGLAPDAPPGDCDTAWGGLWPASRANRRNAGSYFANEEQQLPSTLVGRARGVAK